MFVRDYISDENKKSDKFFLIFIISVISIVIASFVYGCNKKDTELVKYSLVGKEIKREVIKNNINVMECERLTRKLYKEPQLHCENMKEE